ncbi:hypothetical protein TUM3792_09620 [Shewanella sp. MBTL60-007]|nr:hypothetical protein TUM3792_09620 [Shewanella sp. MBTL60-007]
MSSSGLYANFPQLNISNWLDGDCSQSRTAYKGQGLNEIIEVNHRLTKLNPIDPKRLRPHSSP